MGDAEIIPLGTRGRPGRGSGTRRPSSAARGLATGRAGSSAARPSSGRGSSGQTSTGDRHPGAEEPAASSARRPPPEQSAAPPAADDPGPRIRVTDREPTGGVPLGVWRDAATAAARTVFGDQWETRLAQLLAFWRRRLEGDYPVDSYGFDRELTERFALELIRPIAEHWFRLEVRGVENIPTDGGALVVSNHSGTVPMDGLVTMYAVHEHTGRFLRPLGADLVFRLPVIGELARRTGSTLACHEDAERMLRDGELVGVWPEGFKGIGKPFSERYRLQRFGRGGFVSAAVTTGVPIVPLSVVGAEEIYPLIADLPALARLLGMPYIPITPLFPWLGPLGMVPLPSKWILEFGEPIRTDELEDGAAEDPMLAFDVTDQVRESIQQNLYALLRDRPSPFSR